MRRRLSTIVLLLLAVAPVAADEAYPARPITIVAPFPPGGVADLTARPVGAALEKVLKNPVGVVNKTGASGAVGMQYVATSKPDGALACQPEGNRRRCPAGSTAGSWSSATGASG